MLDYIEVATEGLEHLLPCDPYGVVDIFEEGRLDELAAEVPSPGAGLPPRRQRAPSVISFDTEEDAIRIANDTIYGLAAGIWTRDPSRGVRVAPEPCGRTPSERSAI
jgi:hypothetical protein